MAPTQYDKKPEPGDLIEIFRSGYQHWAIYIGDGLVIHLASKNSQAGPFITMSVEMEKLHDVVGKDEYRINNLLDDKYKHRDISEIIKDAKSLVGTTHQYVFSSNSEHFVTNLSYGKRFQSQVQTAVEAILFGVLGGFVATVGFVG